MIGLSPSYLVLFICWAFGVLLDAANDKVRLDPQGPLGITLDTATRDNWPRVEAGALPTRRMLFWSSWLGFNKTVDGLSDAQLWQIVHDAHAEMRTDAAQYKVPVRNIPTAMVVLAVGNELVFASSAKNANSFAYKYEETKVKNTLDLCQIAFFEQSGKTLEHKNGANCGEVLAAQLYYTIHPGEALSGKGARIAAVLWKKAENRPVQTDPFWGCNKFVEVEGLRPLNINDTAEAYDFETMGLGKPKINQMQLCGAPAKKPGSSSNA
ncbi:Uncharacterized protein PECH_000036 [Penicillium ucsense]|uniref:Uncharacterized protein n=1 Tax=Penicillium ucsense TaxID=2839758 RepID=A0A8J8VZR6_9EURO|nr:Uncharacterized protein PECM_007738 [Penicillium ucsense]KAF7739524.1 Uncharacterized protein PECH_000036 [Penicillium ucsense]